MLKIFPFASDLEEVACIRAIRYISGQKPTASSEGMFLTEGSAILASGCEGEVFIGEPS